MTYYHGGMPGLELGDRILPPTVTGQPAAVDFATEDMDHAHVRRDRVFVVTERIAAELFAAMHPSGRGWVYEVEPEDPLEPDPDYRPEPLGDAISWQAPAALIVRVWGPLRPSDQAAYRAALIEKESNREWREPGPRPVPFNRAERRAAQRRRHAP